MKITIEKITPVREGEAVLLKITLTDGINVEQTGGEIASDLFFDMGFPMSEGEGIEISREKYEALEDATALTSAIKKVRSLSVLHKTRKRDLYQSLFTGDFQRIFLPARQIILKTSDILTSERKRSSFVRSLRKDVFTESRA